MKHKILSGTIDDKHFVISIFDDPRIISPMRTGLKRFFEQWRSSKLKEKKKVIAVIFHYQGVLQGVRGNMLCC